MGDVDVDGFSDVVCIHDGPDVIAVTLWTSLGDLQFSRQPMVGVSGEISGAGDVSGFVADLEGDDDPELVFGHNTFVRLGADGNFGCQQSFHVDANGNEAMRAGDIDNDGRDELLSIWDGVLKAHGAP